MKPKIYFQSGFWKSLSSNFTREGIQAMLDVSDALSASFVITDVTEDLIRQDQFLMILIRQGKYVRCDEQYINKKLDSFGSNTQTKEDSEDLCATYLLAKRPAECRNLEEKLGVVAISADAFHEKSKLFKGDGFCLEKSHKYSQRYMTFKDNLRYPCNSLVIIDPYLLSIRQIDSDKLVTFPGIANNLESLLDATLPQALDVTFHLTIFSHLCNGPEDVKRCYEKIKKCIKKIRKNLVVQLGLFYIDKGFSHKVESFHSRHILTNNVLVDSEDGFDLFNEKGYITKNNPAISVVFPKLIGNHRQDMTKYETWLKSVKTHVEESSEASFYGTKENRLFDLV